MKIEIVKKDIYDNLHRMSAHLGLKLQAPEFVSSTPDDESRIAIMLENIFATLLKILQPYALLDIHDDRAVYNLKIPANWNSECLHSLEIQCRMYVSNALCASWLDAVKPDTAMSFRSQSNEVQSAIVQLLEQRERPMR